MLKLIKKLLRYYHVRQSNKKKERLLLNEFHNDFEVFNSMANEEQRAKKEYLYPCFYDKTSYTSIEPIYFYQDSWAFERICNDKPTNHIDIGSQHKFVAHLSKIVNLTMVDIRPLSLPMESIKFIEGSILNLPFEDNSIDSISSLCVIEHIGLGRYGDEIDAKGSEKAILEINRVLKKGANFYMSVPIEEINKVYFNAHRAFNEEYLLNDLLKNYELVCKRYIYGNEFLEHKKKWIWCRLLSFKKDSLSIFIL